MIFRPSTPQLPRYFPRASCSCIILKEGSGNSISRLWGLHLLEPEELLIQRAIRHEHSAFVGLYDLYVERVYRHVYYRVGDQADAEDITQEVFLRAWKAIGRYKPTGAPFFSWLIAISHNLVVDHYKKNAKNKATSFFGSEEEIQSQPISIGNQFFDDYDIDRELLDKAIANLKGDKQRVIVMHFIDGFSYKEIAGILKKSEGAIRVIQHRALLDLRDILISSE